MTEKPPEVAGALSQVAAIPMRKAAGRLEVCLITTRSSGRWSIPKGWPMDGLPDHAAAALEAEEEAGLVGSIKRRPAGEYMYWKRLDRAPALIRVVAYRLKVKSQTDKFREVGQRRIQWFTPADAVSLVDEPGLAALIGQFIARAGVPA